MVDGSAALVYKVNKTIFLVSEILGNKMPDEQGIINFLGGLKFRVTENLLFGVALQAPVIARGDFSWQLVFQPDIEWGSTK